MFYIYMLVAIAWIIHDLNKGGGWDGYWRRTRERNEKFLKCGVTAGKLAWRAYGKHLR